MAIPRLTPADVTIVGFKVIDLRFPTSLAGVGSDAMHVGTNGSQPYIQLLTNQPGLIGEGIVSSCHSPKRKINPEQDFLSKGAHSNRRTRNQAFSNGRGSELICACLEIFAKRVVGKTMHELTRNMGKTWRYMVSDSQYRWVGPEKSITHLATAGVLNGIWDLWGKILSKPVWQIVCDMTPEEIVRCIDFRYITDVITPEEATKMLEKAQEGKEARFKEAWENIAVPAYSTSPGWMALSADKMREVLDQEIKEGYTVFKFKVGSDLEADRAKLAAIRDVLGYDKGYQIMIDANQVSWGLFFSQNKEGRRTN